MKKEEMKKKISGDTALKIFSVLIAICLWFYVVQVQNPDTNRTIKNVPVVFTQNNLLEDKNLILLNNDEYTIDVEIRGPRKNVMGVNRKNLTVLADVGNVEKTGQHTLVTNIVLPYANLQVVGKNPSTLAVDVDDLVSVEKPVEIIAEGTPKASYVVGKSTIEPEKITVKGPKTIVDGIRSVVATVDVNAKSSDVAGKEDFVVYGIGEQEIKSPLLSFSVDEVEVRTEILKASTVELDLVFSSLANSFTEEYELDESSIKTIRVAGVQSLVDSLQTVKTKPITLQDIGESGEVNVTLDLPEGVRSLDGESFTLRFARKNQAE